MKNLGRLALLAAGVLFVAFFSNVAMGAVSGKPPLGDIQEMVTLLGSSILFAVAVLTLESEARKSSESTIDNT